MNTQDAKDFAKLQIVALKEKVAVYRDQIDLAEEAGKSTRKLEERQAKLCRQVIQLKKDNGIVSKA